MASSSVTTPLLADVAPPQQSPRAQHHADLNPAPKKRLLNFWDGVSLTLGIQIGSGIFISPALVARNTSSELPALAVWTAGGLLAWACASCYIEMGTRLPVNGGPQEYLAHCFGDLLGFMASWGCIFGIKPCSAAILALFIADYVCDVAGVGYRSLVALGVVALVTVVNCTGNRLSNVSTKILLACKTIGVGFVIVMGFAVLIFPDLLPPPADVPREPPPANGDAGNYTDALVAAMWAYSGWEVVCRNLETGDMRKECPS
jgi:amino acid transporter